LWEDGPLISALGTWAESMAAETCIIVCQPIHRTRECWDITVTRSPRRACTGGLNPHTQTVEVRCR